MWFKRKLTVEKICKYLKSIEIPFRMVEHPCNLHIMKYNKLTTVNTYTEEDFWHDVKSAIHVDVHSVFDKDDITYVRDFLY